MKVQHRSAQAGLRCAYCHGEPGGALQTCPDCGTRLHAGCQRELGACSTLGCVRGQRAARAAQPQPAHASPLWACVRAALLGWGLAAIQELLLTRHTPTPSDLVAAAVLAWVVSGALGGWLVRGGWGGAPPALASAAYLGAGLAGSASALHRGVWVAAGCLALVALAASWLGSARAAQPPGAA